MVRLLEVLLRFYAHESCGQCSPCREGTDWLYQVVKRIEAGKGGPADFKTIEDLCNNMEGRTVCPLAAAATMPTTSFLAKFRDEFLAHVEAKGCPQKIALKAPVGV
jgi:NADH-quinone oxidoreductase subunit F